MRALDLVATAAALGVFGYFVYKVILPKLGDLELPSFQLPPQITQQPEAPAPAEQLPPPQPIEQDPESKKSKQDDEGGEEESAPPSRQVSPSTIAPPPPVGQLLYDSTKGWSGVTTAASGSPKWTTEAGGIGKLSCGAGHCRVYIAVKNHNARMEGEYMYTGAVDNLSLRLRSRHQEGGACANRFGGFGASVQKTGEVGFKTESCHNLHENSISGKSVGAVQPGTWHKFAYSCYDSPDKKSVNFQLEFDGKTVLTGKHASPKPYYMDEALHQKNSYIWLRSNNSGSGSISFRNFRVIKIGTGASANVGIIRKLMINEPYLYNGYYNRRRL